MPRSRSSPTLFTTHRFVRKNKIPAVLLFFSFSSIYKLNEVPPYLVIWFQVGNPTRDIRHFFFFLQNDDRNDVKPNGFW
jgi:hypothetical protein